MHDHITCPRLVISALRGGAGKSTIAIGLTAALRNQGKRTAPFKKGPDYIDAGWLSLAAGSPCYNLDTFFIPPERVLHSFHTHTLNSDIAVIEGNRGLFDGIDLDGRTSTAEIAHILGAPILLCLDCTKTTRTCAAVVNGCAAFDDRIKIAGIILNRVAGKRHETILRQSLEHYCHIPVIGAIPKLTDDFPERHMGLVPTPEHGWAQEAIQAAAQTAAKYINLDAVMDIAVLASDVQLPSVTPAVAPPAVTEPRPVIAVARDSAFQFYYPENLEALEAAGAALIFTSPVNDSRLPDHIDALYLGGGFPETHARQLSANTAYRYQLAELARAGLPVYAECGGLIYLGEKIVDGDGTHDMCGLLPVTFGISARPEGHGYTISTVVGQNPYFENGTELKGHEFRYSKVLSWGGKDEDMVFSTVRGKGFMNQKDGIRFNNVLATYTHLHALGTPSWAPALVRIARAYHQIKKAE
ncbi:MAG: cobyrinate a,c-diamide synthase [Thermodesulfobacteriota bacterium]